MSNSPIPLPKKLKIAYFYALNNTYRSIAEKTPTSKTTVQRVINLMDSEEIEEIIYDFKTRDVKRAARASPGTKVTNCPGRKVTKFGQNSCPSFSIFLFHISLPEQKKKLPVFARTFFVLCYNFNSLII